MNRNLWGLLRRLTTRFNRYCEYAHITPSNENFARWLAEPDFAADRLGWSLTQQGEQPKPADGK